MPLIETPHWWRKHGVTVWGTVVEAGFPKSRGGVSSWQPVTLEIEEPGGGTVRVDTELLVIGPLRVGDRDRYRYDPKSRRVEMWNRSTVPEQEWWEEEQRATAPPQPVPGADAAVPAERTVRETVNVVNVSGDDPQALVARLAGMRDQGLMTPQQYEQAARQLLGAAEAPAAADEPGEGSVAERLQQLDRLRDQGLVGPDEYVQQRQRILGSI